MRTSLTAAALLVILNAHARAGAPDQYNVGADRVAVGGYDVVSYFDGKPVRGDSSFSTSVDGIVYKFASQAALDRFNTDPQKFKPAYGGWCATAMAKGKKVEIDPLNFKITNGRLFLFYKGLWGNALKDWNKDEGKLTTDADTHWKRISGE